MTSHGLASEFAIPSPEGSALLAWCHCGQSFTARDRTARKALRMIRRKFRDHRGMAYTAGPGWADVS